MKTPAELPGPVARPGSGHEVDIRSPARRTHWVSRTAKAALSVALSLSLLALLFRLLPGSPPCFGHRWLPAKPKTIEERVKHILTRTPLIGNPGPSLPPLLHPLPCP